MTLLATRRAAQRTNGWLAGLDGHRLLGCRVPNCPELAAHEGMCARCLHARLLNTRRQYVALQASHGALLVATRRLRALLRTDDDLLHTRVAARWRDALVAALERLDGIDPPAGGSA